MRLWGLAVVVLGGCVLRGPGPADVAEDALLADALARAEANSAAACAHVVACMPGTGPDEEAACRWGNRSFLQWDGADADPADRAACVAAVDGWFRCVGETACPELRGALRASAPLCPSAYTAMQAACPAPPGPSMAARQAVLRAP